MSARWGTRARLLAAVHARLQRCFAGDLSAALEKPAADEARRLSEYLDDDDAELRIRHALAWLHWFRFRGLPEGPDEQDWAATVSLFAQCFLTGEDLAMPAPLLPYVTDAAAVIAARELRESPRGELASGNAVETWRRIVRATPDDHPNRPGRLHNLAALLMERFSVTENPDDVEEAVRLGREVLRLAPPGHPNRAVTLFNLHQALWTRFERTGEHTDLDEAIRVGREAAADLADAAVEATLLSNLRSAYWARFERSGDPADLDEAIRAGRRAVQVMPLNSADRATTVSNVGLALLRRFERDGDDTDLEEAVQLVREAARATPVDDEGRGQVLSNLGVVLGTRFKRHGVHSDLEEATRTAREAVHGVRPGRPDDAMALSNLASLLLLRFEHTGERALLDQVVGLLRRGVEATPPQDASQRAFSLANLATALLARHMHIGDLADLDEAVRAGREAVEAAPPDTSDRAAVLAALGSALESRSQRTGDQADLDEAVATLRESTRTGPLGDPARAGRLMNLTGALLNRFDRTGARADLDEAIDIGGTVTRSTPGDHPDLGQMLNNLGVALHLRFERTKAADEPAASEGTQPATDLDKAVDTLRRAIGTTAADHVSRTAVLANLGNALRARYELSGRPEDLDEAVHAGRETVRATRVGHPDRSIRLNNLGLALRLRFERTEDGPDLEEAIHFAREAVDASPADHPDLAQRLINLGVARRLRHQRTGDIADLTRAADAYHEAWRITTAPPRLRIHAAHAAAGLLAEAGPARAADLLEAAVRLLPEVAPRRLERGDQQYALGLFPNLAGDAAALALASGEGTDGQRAARALRLLEAGRAVLLSQALDISDDLTDLRGRHPGLAARLADLRDRIDRPATPSGAVPAAAGPGGAPGAADRLARDRQGLAQDLADTLAEIRAHPGFAAFGLPPTTGELLAEAGQGPVAVLNVSRVRSDALLLTRAGVTAIPLPRLDHDTLIRRVLAFHQALDTAVAGPDAVRRGAAQAVLVRTLEWLWDTVAEPVLTALGHHRQPPEHGAWPRVWWSPGGLLGLLPLHAAGHHTDPAADPERRTVLDRVVSSFTPTVRALRHARRPVPAQGSAQRALVVAMPTTPGPRGGRPLPHVPEEVDRVCRHLGETVLLSTPGGDGHGPGAAPDPPTKADVLAHLPVCTIAHFSCHGESHPTDPSQSRLLLDDHATDPLTVAGLAPVRLEHAELAYLSACQTATVRSADLVDEAIHLSSAFQLAGFRHVIGTLWSISDRLAVTVADAFYGHLRTGHGTLDTGRAALALHHAMRAVRDGHDLPDGRDRTRVPSLWAAYLHSGA
ncbi:CHAT domain-containing protein [Streptomyces sp. NPDC006458]|uniref:CHAT domain-containing protein n=1 Tax=Streptomyces sp. NPDC006458 TaxID=3154302 RepID=UPI0033B93ADB